MMQKIRTFLEEVKGEMKKVTWPTFLQTKGSTWVVIIMVLMIGVYFGVIDFFLAKFIHIFLG
ncbi:MAG: preprotein translocase subunit SecE [Nitrospirae bacterium CG_4_9_14_3_um_filter_53_35]|nr:MAG: preprotein translocase subunit SecE [Nitrospirae bacterium CG2_30_53_67]PIS37437.1 MAG: preprotein translocase subunit SecE [Nitrospirae bacterium CG08_land_8_20_14_0_20_52_24]PIV82298.1 MAG: preprotein translocase subunit SecE [Nitrospirae bacterium CG17_big_fil_post_rev_8_21_14_2_50_50_9]PIW85808.1 MAG: preprotein translocase subunit SecE [Nitrospirae bacterium CG_4_8_14_3_um_filter_50_41]PIX85729.1 MAG: preprotein translocase subunit SecE [Nitrospirae bacterium CG_4_10_14_3_um_filter